MPERKGRARKQQEQARSKLGASRKSAADKMPPRRVAERALGRMFSPRIENRRFGAQDIAYEAMEAMDNGDAERAIELATQAAKIDPTCVDAISLLAQAASENRDELIANMTRVVEDGARALGPKFFAANRGHFWGILETRPYMRARSLLAKALVEAGRHDEAIRHHEEMLDLCPNDNLGLRYPLIGLYLRAGRPKDVARLFKQYEDEGSAMFAWARVLERLLAGDEPGAAAALREAREANPHVEAFLTGRKRRPRGNLGYYSPGEESEAIVCLDCLGDAWSQHRNARQWLRAAPRP